MRKKKDYTILAVSIPVFIALMGSGLFATEEPRKTFYNGQQLLPDYVHLDTLRVVDAEYLNAKIGQMQTDADIWELLNETTETEQEYQDNQ